MKPNKRRTSIPPLSPEQIREGVEFTLRYLLSKAEQELLVWKGTLEKELRDHLGVRINEKDHAKIFEKATCTSHRRYFGRLITSIVIVVNRIPSGEFFKLAKWLGAIGRVPFYNDRLVVASKLQRAAFVGAKVVTSKAAALPSLRTQASPQSPQGVVPQNSLTTQDTGEANQTGELAAPSYLPTNTPLF
jgi:hypothetical protein